MTDTGILMPMPVIRAVDGQGLPINGAQLQFYLTGTTTPQNVFTDDTLMTPLANPVVSDGAGLFVPIFLDPTVTYRVQLKDGAGTLIRDVDPVSIAPPAASQGDVNAGTATNEYVSPATLAGWTGIPAALGYTPLNKAGDTATNLQLAFSAATTTDAGFMGAPINEQDTAYTFALTDRGKIVRGNNASAMAYTIPPNSSVAFPLGCAILVRNVGAGTITLTRGSGVTQMLAGSGTNKDVSLVQYGLCTLFQEAANSWVASGTGIS